MTHLNYHQHLIVTTCTKDQLLIILSEYPVNYID